MRVAVLPGDGIGPVVLREATRVLEAVGVTDLVEAPFGYRCWRRTGEALPAATERLVRETGIALLGAATTPDTGLSSPILALRRRLGLEVYVRPAAGVTVVGHAWEGLYAEPESAGNLCRRVVTPGGAGRLMEVAFARARRMVTIVDKPTVFRESARLLREAADRAARPGIAYEVVNADAFVAALVRAPQRYDVIAALSFVADVVSDLTAALGRGLGAAPSANLGEGLAVFEPVHGSAPSRAAEDPPRVNPVGAILAAAMLLDHAGSGEAANRVREAVDAVHRSGVRTADEGGTASATDVGDAVVAALTR